VLPPASSLLVGPRAAISILKQHGKSAADSMLVEGFALNCTRASRTAGAPIPSP